jgi:hypothetical protein
MIFKGKEVNTLTLVELQSADWELFGVEANYLESLKHPRLQKLKPKPEMSKSFQDLRNEIKQEIKRKSNNAP